MLCKISTIRQSEISKLFWKGNCCWTWTVSSLTLAQRFCCRFSHVSMGSLEAWNWSSSVQHSCTNITQNPFTQTVNDTVSHSRKIDAAVQTSPDDTTLTLKHLRDELKAFAIAFGFWDALPFRAVKKYIAITSPKKNSFIFAATAATAETAAASGSTWERPRSSSSSANAVSAST